MSCQIYKTGFSKNTHRSMHSPGSPCRANKKEMRCLNAQQRSSHKGSHLISNIQTLENATSQTAQVLQEENYEEKKGMEKNLHIKETLPKKRP